MSGRLFGYARVSTFDQNAALQVDALRRVGVSDDAIFVEQISGATGLSARTALRDALDACAPGDKLVVWKLDRLARSVREMLNITRELEAVGVQIECVQGKFDTTTATGRLFFNIMACFAEFERDMIVERTKAGARRLSRAWNTFGQAALARPRRGHRPFAVRPSRARCRPSASLWRKHDPQALPGLPAARPGAGEGGGMNDTRHWLPIDTAPRDGTQIDILIRGTGRVPDVEWGMTDGLADDYETWISSFSMMPVYGPCEDRSVVTHWLPIPPAPGPDFDA